MSIFRELLSEGRDAPLYHATIFENAQNIFIEDAICDNTQHHYKDTFRKINGAESSDGVSTTRSLMAAKKWLSHPIIFELDQKKLSHNYKLAPVEFFKTNRKKNGGEYEEFVIGIIKPIKRYVKQIHISKATWTKYGDDDLFQDLISRIRSSKIHIVMY